MNQKMTVKKEPGNPKAHQDHEEKKTLKKAFQHGLSSGQCKRLGEQVC